MSGWHQTSVISVLKKVYPVGSVYINASDSTNPGTLLGFGTWTAFGAGRVPVGLNSGDADFDTAEETGGAKTVSSNVTVATQPTFTVDSHTHALSDSGYALLNFSATAIARRISVPAWTNAATHQGTLGSFTTNTTNPTTATALGGATDATAGTATTRTANVALTNNATSVVQPYITVYMWKRTA